MPDVNPIAIAAATVAAFLISSVYYAMFAAKMAALRGVEVAARPERPPASKLVAELLRSLVLATVIAAVISRGQIDTAAGALALAAAAWVGFPVILLAGSVLWEDVPHRLAFLHAGDWLIKLAAVAAIIGAVQ